MRQLSKKKQARVMMNRDDGTYMSDALELFSKVLPSVVVERVALGGQTSGNYEVWENERYYPFTSSFSKTLLPSDRPAWSNKEGTDELRKSSFARPPSGAVWLTEWSIDRTGAGTTADEKGWRYSHDFAAAATGAQDAATLVRRRRWVREFGPYTDTPVATPLAPHSSDGFESFGDAGSRNSMRSSISGVSSSLMRHGDHVTEQERELTLVVAETWENQRTYPFVGFTKNLLPTDRHNWSDKYVVKTCEERILTQHSHRTGKRRLQKEEIGPPKGRVWAGDWQIERTQDTDKVREQGSTHLHTRLHPQDGWRYAVDFPFDFHSKKSAHHAVRRRRWLRHAVPRETKVAQISGAFAATEDGEDVTIVRQEVDVLYFENPMHPWHVATARVDADGVCTTMSGFTWKRCRFDAAKGTLSFEQGPVWYKWPRA